MLHGASEMKLNFLTCSIVFALSGIQASESSAEAGVTASMATLSPASNHSKSTTPWETLGTAFTHTTTVFSTEWSNLTEAISKSTTPSTITTASGSQNDLDNSLDTGYDGTHHPNAIGRSLDDTPRRPYVGSSNNFTFDNEVN